MTADDDPQLLRLIARNLAFEGYEVTTASQPDQGKGSADGEHILVVGTGPAAGERHLVPIARAGGLALLLHSS